MAEYEFCVAGVELIRCELENWVRRRGNKPPTPNQESESQAYKDGITSRRCQCHGNAKDTNEMLKSEIKIYCGFYNGPRVQRACYVVQDCQNLRM